MSYQPPLVRVVHLYSSLVTNKKSFNNFPWLLKSAECFYRTRNTQIQYIGDKCRVSVRFSVVGVHCHSLVLLPLAVTEHITVIWSYKGKFSADQWQRQQQCIDGSDDGQGQGSSYSAAVPWKMQGKACRGRRRCRRAAGGQAGSTRRAGPTSGHRQMTTTMTGTHLRTWVEGSTAHRMHPNFWLSNPHDRCCRPPWPRPSLGYLMCPS